ncbi:hypothetical protein C0Q70_13279 [Pomacea canaliculata]|uniref:GH10 domain-containing protein n=1 Tax=Pomacea canaliculata TaxID=400727 RepID=A0A2T7NWR9_POMCA|nr:uncharacterized protein LOC112570472 [Pomacea canaliculata]PVD25620.1 hypothetical protein C0Q70_13279 [Pomacea canaliculata]
MATWMLLSLAVCFSVVAGELVQNGDFESMSGWNCWNFQCQLIASGDSRFGSHSLSATGRTQDWMGPSQNVQMKPGQTYRVSSCMKILNDLPNTVGQSLQLMVSFTFADGSNTYMNAALQPMLRVADGWVCLQGDLQAPTIAFTSATFYFQGPAPGVGFAVDQASITELNLSDANWRQQTDEVINRVRKSDINLRITTDSGVTPSQVQIKVKQTKKSFPFGSAVSAYKYVDSTQQKYRDWIHTHLNWAVLENALKWTMLEWDQGNFKSEPAMGTIKGLTSHGIKVRGHNLVWSASTDFIPPWVRALSGDQLRTTVKQHIEKVCNMTRGYLQHWDVNNENLHGWWFQDRLQDRDYDLEIFRIAHKACPDTLLFLNEYSVVAGGGVTQAYLEQAKRFKAANVGLGGIGVQSHFAYNFEPSPALVKYRLDTLKQAGVSIWATEMTVEVDDENKRADYYERALRALYGHEAVDGILLWGFWDQAHYAGEKAALVRGDNLELTAAGRRVLHLLEEEWMTDETFTPTSSNSQHTVRGFHGDYEVTVLYKGSAKSSLTQRFTLGKAAHAVTIHVTA